MLDAKIDTLILITLKTTEMPDDKADILFQAWSERIVSNFQRNLKQRNLPEDLSDFLGDGG